MTCNNPIENAHTSRLHVLVALKFSKIVDTRRHETVDNVETKKE